MDDIEHLVRVTLNDRAADLGAPRDLARAARGRAHRDRRRAQAVGVAVAAAAVLLAMPAVAWVWSADGRSTVDAAAPGTVEPLVPAFPFTPEVSLPGYGEPVAELSAGLPALRFDGGAERWLTVEVFTERPASPRWDVQPKASSEFVAGRRAALDTGADSYLLTWRDPGGWWLRVEASRRVARADLIRFAEGLTPGGVPVRWPFTFEAVPPGLVPDVVSRAAVAFRPQSSPPSHGFTGKLTVMLSETAEVTPGDRRVAVGGRVGWIAEPSGVPTLSVDLGDGRTLVIQSGVGLGLGAEELAAFAAGVRPTPDAAVGRG